MRSSSDNGRVALSERVSFPDRGFSLCPPAGWEQADFGDGDPTRGVKFVAPGGAATLVVDLPPRKGAFEDHVRGYRAALAVVFAGAKVGPESRVSIDGRDAVQFSLVYGAPPRGGKSSQALIPANDRVLTAYAYGDPEALDRHAQDIEACFASMKTR